MAFARQQENWCMLGTAVAHIVNANGVPKNKAVQPLDIIPKHFHPRPEPEPELTPEEKAEKKRRAWESFDQAFGVTRPSEAE